MEYQLDTGIQSKPKNPKVKRKEGVWVLCPDLLLAYQRRESNPHSRRNTILSRARLPIPPLWQILPHPGRAANMVNLYCTPKKGCQFAIVLHSSFFILRSSLFTLPSSLLNQLAADHQFLAPDFADRLLNNFTIEKIHLG